MFGRARGKAEKEQAARRAELEGDLARAVVLWDEAGKPEEAARVFVLRGDAEIDPLRRRQHYVQAVALAPPGTTTATAARTKRAALAIAIARDGAGSAIARHELLEAAADLEAIGEGARAAEAYALAGDREGEARALVQAGEVERLEDVLTRDRARDAAEHAAKRDRDEVERALALGHRREALAKARQSASLAEVARSIEMRRATADRTPIELRGRPMLLALGAQVVVGRGADECAIVVAVAAASRRHVALERDGQGNAVLRDLGSRNGTELRGMRIAGALPIPREGLDVKLGGEVPLRVSPTDALEGAIAIDVGGTRWIAPLGDAELGIGEWRLEAASDGWLELVTGASPAFALDGSELAGRVPLLTGDAFTDARGGAVLLRLPPR